MIKVVNRHKYKGDGIYIGRGTIYGNPYSHKDFSPFKVGTREEAIEKYREHMRAQWVTDEMLRVSIIAIAERHLAGEDIVLICSCKPLACHGDVLREAIERTAANISDAVNEESE